MAFVLRATRFLLRLSEKFERKNRQVVPLWTGFGIGCWFIQANKTQQDFISNESLLFNFIGGAVNFRFDK